MKKSSSRKLCITVMMMLLITAPLFAADDYGFNEYMGKVKTFLMAIGGALLLVSLSIWAIKAVWTKNITPEDKKAITVMAMGGIILVIGPTIVSSVFGSLGGSNI